MDLLQQFKQHIATLGFIEPRQKLLLAVSGGIDSALTLVLAVEALGKENVLAVLLPSKYFVTLLLAFKIKVKGPGKLFFINLNTDLSIAEVKSLK